VGVRRERPPIERGGTSIRLRLPDGTVKALPVDDARRTSPDVCCFCGEAVEPDGGEFVRLSARWSEGDEERTQSWDAHRSCLAERLHDSASFGG
jgi:hypothetical protein